MKYVTVMCLSCITLSVFTLIVSAQSEARSRVSEPVEQRATQTDADHDGQIVACGYDLVVVPVAIRGRNGVPTPDLEWRNFTIYEDEVEQSIAFFSKADEPPHIILMLDTGMTGKMLSEIQSDALAFIELVQPGERVKILAFGNEAQELCDFTGDRDTLRQAIYQAQPGQAKRLYDAMSRALGDAQPLTTPTAIMLFTDGVDYGSVTATRVGSLREVEKSTMFVYPIRYETPTEAERTRAGRYLKKLAAKSGGKVYRADGPGSLPAAFAHIAAQLRTQYLIGYYPDNIKFDGSYRRVKVRSIREDIILRARPGYRAPSAEQ